MFDIKELQQKLDTKINKISFMIFGEENLKGKVKIDDSILSRAFMHTDMTIREGIDTGRDCYVFKKYCRLGAKFLLCSP